MEAGHFAMVELLVDNRANIDQERNDGLTPLKLALDIDSHAMLRLLLRKGANINKQTGRASLMFGNWKSSLLSDCVSRYGSAGYMLPLILAHGPDVNAEGCEHFTSLQLAISHRNETAITALVDSGADLGLASRAAAKPLIHAIKLGYPEVVTLLITHGCKTVAQGTQPLRCTMQLKLVRESSYLLS